MTLPLGRRLRFIPACAGNRLLSNPLSLSRAVHPRVCGEQTSSRSRSRSSAGSSPRVRGTVCNDDAFICYRRFIPACAGNRKSKREIIYRAGVHPRVCGEQFARHIVNELTGGSSPRVRGTVLLYISKNHTDRFIPACAGNRYVTYAGDNLGTVHPRVCGEQSLPLPSLPLPSGSSPRVRGTGWPCSLALFAGRFIPACAGNRRASFYERGMTTVHPRVCGEQVQRLRHQRLDRGSSPRVRGTVQPSLRGTAISRFIPACAGNSLPIDASDRL